MEPELEDLIGKFETHPFPIERNLIIDSTGVGNQVPKMISYHKVDITKALEIRERLKQERDLHVSITGWIIKCIATAISEHKEIAAFRKGKKIIIFDDIDVAMMIDIESGGKKHAAYYTIRKADKKTLKEVLKEVDATKCTRDGSWFTEKQIRMTKLLARFPRAIRGLFWKRFLDPFVQKVRAGVLLVTSVGMATRIPSWGASPSVFNFQMTIGSLEKEPAIVDGRLENRTKAYLMVVSNREIVDGTEIMGFMDRVGELTASAHLLDTLL